MTLGKAFLLLHFLEVKSKIVLANWSGGGITKELLQCHVYVYIQCGAQPDGYNDTRNTNREYKQRYTLLQLYVPLVVRIPF